MTPRRRDDIRIIGTGIAVPSLVTNQDVVEMLPDLGITVEWLETSVGIKQKHVSIDGMQPPSSSSSSSSASSARVPRQVFANRSDLRAGPGLSNSDLCAQAIRNAIATTRGGMSLADIDMIIVSTVTPDVPVPGTSTYVMEKLGLNDVQVMDIRSACCGSTLALQTAVAHLKSGQCGVRVVAVVGSEVGSIFGNLDPSHPAFTRGDAVNAAMIGDAAAALIVTRFDDEEDGHHNTATTDTSAATTRATRATTAPYGIEVLHVESRCIGRGKEPGMHIPCGGCARPFSASVLRDGGHFFHHDFKKVLEHGAELYYAAIQNGLRALGASERFAELRSGGGGGGGVAGGPRADPRGAPRPPLVAATLADVDFFIPHQANGRITSYAVKMGIEASRCHEHFATYGNTANASLPLGIHLEAERDALPDGGIVMCLAAESTKWLHGTIVLCWHPMRKQPSGVSNGDGSRTSAPQTQAERAVAGGVAATLYRLRAVVWFWAAGWLVRCIGVITWMVQLLRPASTKQRAGASDGRQGGESLKAKAA